MEKLGADKNRDPPQQVAAVNNSYDLNDCSFDNVQENKEAPAEQSILRRSQLLVSDQTESFNSHASNFEKHMQDDPYKFNKVKESANQQKPDNIANHEQVKQVVVTSGPENDNEEDSIGDNQGSINKQKKKHHHQKPTKTHQKVKLYQNQQRPLSNCNMNKLMEDFNSRNLGSLRSPLAANFHARTMTFDDLLKNSKLHMIETSKDPKFIKEKEEESKRQSIVVVNNNNEQHQSYHKQSDKGAFKLLQLSSPNKGKVVGKPPLLKKNLKLDILDEEVASPGGKEEKRSLVMINKKPSDVQKFEQNIQINDFSVIKRLQQEDQQQQQQHMNSMAESRINHNQSNLITVTDNSLFQAMNLQDRSTNNLGGAASFLIGDNDQLIEQKDIQLMMMVPNNEESQVNYEVAENEEELKQHAGDVTFIEADEAETPEELGLIVKKTIEAAHKGQVIHLPDTHIKVTDLLILRPITVKGRPGTILEITKGSIIIDFDQEERSQKEVGIICECDIIFSDRADQIQIKEELDREERSSQHHNRQVNRISSNRLNLELSPQLLNCHQQSNTDNSSGMYALFQIRNYTYVEVRDCSLTSKNKQSVMDAAFVMNEKDSLDPFKCILSVKSCNIKNFSVGFVSGTNSILSVELSYITDCTLSGIMCCNPKLLKLSGTIIENVEGHGVDIKLYNNDESSKELIKKICIEDNKIQNCKEAGIFIHGLVTSSLEQNLIEQQNVNAIVKLFKNRIYLNKLAGIYLKRLNVLQLEINSCDLYYNEEHNILMSKVKPKSLEQVVIVKSRIAEAENGIIAKDCMSFTISDTEFSKNKMSGLYIIDTGAEKNIIRSEMESQVFPLFEKPNVIINSQTEWIGDDREELAVNRNLTVGNTGRIHQGLITSTLISAAGINRPDINNSSLNNMNQLIPSSNTNGLSTQPHLQQTTGVPLKPIQKKSTQKVLVGEVYITKCKFIENKLHGIHLQNIYQKTVEINSCRLKDNLLNGLHIAQDVDPEDEVVKQIQLQQNSISSDKIQMTDNNANFNINNSKLLIMRKDIIKYAKVIVSNCEIQTNKLHGIEMSLVRTIVKHCIIKDNISCAIKLTTENSKMLLKLYDSLNRGKPMIKGKVGGDWGELINPIKELQTEEDQESELGMFLKNVADVEDAGAISIAPNKNKSKVGCFSCIGKQQKKQLDSLGEYVIIKESRKDKNIVGPRGKGVRMCLTPSNQSVAQQKKNSKKGNGCHIF